MGPQECVIEEAEKPGTPGALTIRHAQENQPWTVPYSSRFEDAASAIRLPHLYATHAVLHAQKTVGKLAAVFEAIGHREGVAATAEELATIAAMSADMVTMALRLANLYHFDLADVLVRRVEEKNGVNLLKKAAP